MGKAWHTVGLVVGLIFILFAGNALAAKLYRWVDDEGKVHYTDKIPPKQSHKAHRQLNDQGITVKVQKRAKTPEEKEAERRQKEMEKQEAIRREEQAKKDNILLQSYRSEQDIEQAYSSKIQAIQGRINFTQGKRDILEKNLETLHNQAANYEVSGKKVPQKLLDKIKFTKEQMQLADKFIGESKQDQQAFRDQAEKKKKRFREIMEQRKKEEDKSKRG